MKKLIQSIREAKLFYSLQVISVASAYGILTLILNKNDIVEPVWVSFWFFVLGVVIGLVLSKMGEE